MNRCCLVALLLLLAAAPVSAHEPTAAEFVPATATPDTMATDGDLDEEAWDSARDDEIEFDSPNDRDTAVWFTWSPEDEKLYVGITVDDSSDDADDDFVDFAIAFDHTDEDADDGDQVIVRAQRDGTIRSVSVEDESTVSAGAPAGVDADVVDDPGSGYVVELAIDWEDVHGGWAIWQADNADDAAYPEDAEREDPTTWADVKGVKLDLDVTLTVDKVSAKVDDTLTLTAAIANFDDLIEFDEKVLFQRWDGTAWTTVVSKSPDDDGEAKTTTKVSTPGPLKYRARIVETDLYSEAVSSEISVTVADVSTKLYGDASLFVRYATDADGWRTYTIVSNTTTSFPTLEASPDGAMWTRLTSGAKGAPLTATWTPPDNGVWHVRGVAYDAAGKASAPVAAEASAYTLPGTKTATALTLNATANGTGVDLVASVAPAASGTVKFYRAPDVELGTGTLTSGVAKLVVAKALPGEHTYVARYSGSATHAPSTDRAEFEYWPASTAGFAPRATDAAGEKVTVAVTGGSVVFAARAGEGPGIPGAVEILATPEGGEAEVVFRGMTTTGSVSTPFRPDEVGTYDVSARFWRGPGTGVALDVRNTTASGKDRPVEVTLTAPTEAGLNETIEILVTLDPAPTGGNVTLLVDGETVATEDAAGNATFTWTAWSVGEHTLKVAYSGAPGFSAADSSALTVDVEDAAAPGDEGPAPETEEKGLPGLAWFGAALALGLAARKRR